MPTGVYKRNHALRPQTFRDCAKCGVRFGPLPRLSRKYCSVQCKVEAQRLPPGKRKPRQAKTKAAIYAHSRIAYLLRSGRLEKPETCETCGESRPLEASHSDYSLPELVRWLCVPCHRREDWAAPKGGTKRE